MARSKRLTLVASALSGPHPQSGHWKRAAPAADEPFVHKHPIRILRLAQVLQVTGLGKTTLYDLQSQGAFPMRVKITEHSVGWVEQDVQSWLERRVALSGAARIPQQRWITGTQGLARSTLAKPGGV